MSSSEPEDDICSEEYFLWLCERVKAESDDHFGHTILLEHLFNRDFYSLVGNDDNRESEGRALRDIFSDDSGIDSNYVHSELDGPCSIFEMMVALAERAAFMTDGDEEELGEAEWFWEMIDNLGLEGMIDSIIVKPGMMQNVDKILNRFLDRKYTRHGIGGLFPCPKSDTDQRKVELWYQLSEYIFEKNLV